ncbi:hypothetical protein PMAYCL1PPCAC_11426, partial [Pristionchus mayeri]
PANAFFHVCSYLNDMSLLDLRKVSKGAKDTVDRWILNSKKTKVSEIYIEQIIEQIIDQEESVWVVKPGEWSISFSFYDIRDYNFWRNGLRYALSHKEFNLQDSETRFEEPVIFVEVRQLEHVRMFFELLKPCCKRAEYGDLTLQSHPDILRPLLDFFATNTIRELFLRRIEDERIDVYPMFIDFIKIVNPKDVRCQLHLLHKHSISFLRDL